MSIDHSNSERRWRSPTGWALGAFLLVTGYSLWSESRTQVVEALPYLLLLACMGAHLLFPGARGSRRHDQPVEPPRR